MPLHPSHQATIHSPDASVPSASTTASSLPSERWPSADDDAVLASLAQFDLLQALAAIASSRSLSSSVYYPNFARFYNERVEPIVVRLLQDQPMRATIFPLPDPELAQALQELSQQARREGNRFLSGFFGFQNQRILDFVNEHQPNDPQGTLLSPGI